MSKPKYVNFFEQLSSVVNNLDTADVKLSIGDSINNNRTLTVGQVVRFLLNSSSRKNIALGRSLQSIFGLIKTDIINSRVNLRTDAVDINEFLNFYTAEVLLLGEYRNVIGRTLVA